MFKKRVKEEDLQRIISLLEWRERMVWEDSKKYQKEGKRDMANYADGRASGMRSAVGMLRQGLNL